MEPKEEMIQNPNMVQEPVLVEVQDTIQILLMIFTEIVLKNMAKFKYIFYLLKSSFLHFFGNISAIFAFCIWIRIQEASHNADPDPDAPIMMREKLALNKIIQII